METRNKPQDNVVEKSNHPATRHTPVDEQPRESFGQTVLTPEQAAKIKSSVASARPKRTFRFHMKLVESDKSRRQIEGYASTRDIDRTGEIVEPGAFADSLKDFMANPVLTYMHDWSNPIGKVTDVRIDDVGLFIRAEISETAEKVWKLIEEGILRAFSIGYEVVEEKVLGGVNHILKLRLYEVAVVSIPANRRALFSVSKALETGNDLVHELPADGPSSEKLQPMPTEEHSSASSFSDTALNEAHAILKEVMENLGAGSAASENS